MKISQYFASLICICLTQIHVSCNGQEASSFTGNESTDVVKIIVRSKDIQESFTVTPEKVSEHFVVPLETTDASLIGKLDKAIRHEDKIFVLDSDLAKTVFCFDLDGKFLFKLGRLGKGPGEYRELRDIVLYPSTNEIGVLDGDKIIWYNTGDGSFTGAATELKNIMLDKVSLLDSTRLIGYANNQCFSKQYCSSFYSFTKNGEITNQYLPIQKKEKDLYIDHENPFSGGRYSIGFTHLLNDTLYTIDASDQMIPKVLFDFTDMAVKNKSELPENLKQYERWHNKSLKNKSVTGLSFYHETTDAIQFRFRRGTDLVWGIYLKKIKKLILSYHLFANEIMVTNINIGIDNDKFINYIPGELVLQIQDHITSSEYDLQDLIDTYGQNVYDYLQSLDGIANPILIFSKFKNDL